MLEIWRFDDIGSIGRNDEILMQILIRLNRNRDESSGRMLIKLYLKRFLMKPKSFKSMMRQTKVSRNEEH
jgi:hypothetical protein